MSLVDELKEMVDKTIEEEAQAKIANVNEAYKGDKVAQQCFLEAMDIVKEAEDKGEIERLDASNFITVSAKLADTMREERAKLATIALGEAAGEALAREGYDIAELGNLAGDEAKEASKMLVEIGLRELKARGVDTSDFTQG